MKLRILWALGALNLLIVLLAYAGHALDGLDVKVTDDNNNVDGGLAAVTPSKDAQNRQSNEPTVAISNQASPETGMVGDLVAAGANDYRMVPHFGDSWMPVYLSFNGGATWFGAPPFPDGFNTMIPGFPTDTSAEGLASPLKNLDGSGDPVVRFDADGNLFVAGIAFNRTFQPEERPVDNLVYVSRYDYTPGTPATASTTTTAGSAPISPSPEPPWSSAAQWASRCRARSASRGFLPTRSGWRSIAILRPIVLARAAST